MNYEEDIQKFENWAINIGCPIELIPPKRALARIFASRQALGFHELLRRIKPINEVKVVRNQIAVRKIEKVNGKLLSTLSMHKQAEQMQRFLKVRKLQKCIQEKQLFVDQVKGEYLKLAASVKENNIKRKHSKEKIAELLAKQTTLKISADESEQQLSDEYNIMKEIDNITPVKMELSNSNERNASDAIVNAIDELQKFYSSHSQNGNYDDGSAAREKLWEKLREVFGHIPNFVLWNRLSKQMEQQLLTIEAMSKMNITEILNSSTTNYTIESNLKLNIGKLYAKHIDLAIQKNSLKNEKKHLLVDYVNFYNSFLNDLREKFSIYNNFNIDDEFLAEYLNHYSSHHYGQGQIEFLQKTIGEIDVEIERRGQVMDDHQVTNNSLRCMYEEIENLYCRMHEDMLGLTHVKEKIQHNEDLMGYLVQCKNDQQHSMLTAAGTRLNASASSSFNSTNDSVFCSTKLDNLDTTMMTVRSEIVFNRPVMSMMPHRCNEIKAFLHIPFEKFKVQLLLQNEMEISDNPLVKEISSNFTVKEVIALLNNHLVTPKTCLKEFKQAIDWYGKLHGLQKGGIVVDKLPIVDMAKVAALKSQQIEDLTELTDKTKIICCNTKEVMNSVDDYFQFLQENLFSKFIPKKKLFNGHTYEDYEREFMMYYNMIKNVNV